jgi:predicted Rossmann fold flavoprotein
VGARARGTSRSRLREQALDTALAVAVDARYDVAVLGAGAAGLAAAIAAAEAGASVVALERDLECGRTILATGNGRCNFSNAELSPERYNDPAFVKAVCGEHFGEDVLAFFGGCGLAWAQEDERLYPLSRQATSVRDVLVGRARHAGATLACAREVTGLEKGDDGSAWRVSWRDASAGFATGTLDARAVVLACGGGPSLADELGLERAPYEPVLCSLACDAIGNANLAALDGRRAHVVARLLRDGRVLARERGEVLFRAYGISGIVTFDLSRAARPGDVVSLDLTCGLDATRARELVERAGGTSGLLDPRIAAALGAAPSEQLERARDLRFVVRGPADPERAQLTRGGLLVSQFDATTLEGHKAPGLFACGESLNVDGACGGFNLAWAWKSGLVAGSGAAARAQGKEGPCSR